VKETEVFVHTGGEIRGYRSSLIRHGQDKSDSKGVEYYLLVPRGLHVEVLPTEVGVVVTHIHIHTHTHDTTLLRCFSIKKDATT